MSGCLGFIPHLQSLCAAVNKNCRAFNLKVVYNYESNFRNKHSFLIFTFIFIGAKLITDIKNYIQVSDKLSSAGQPLEEQLNLIKDAGFEVVINFGMHNNPEYSLKDEAGSVIALGMGYIHIPVIFENPVRQNLLDFFKAMEDSRGKKVFVHCAMNMRASTFIGLYNAIRLKQPPEQAFEIMRRIWEPNEVWQAFIGKMLSDPDLK
jgi:protein tyrosine phosphatase (PTP) superfamily phosphohydrolase (DUF442 family)